MNRNPDVDAWFETYENPMKDVMQAVRLCILEASPEMREDIKWKAPNFFHKGNMATFNPRAKKNASLLFHTGAFLNDTTGLLEGDGAEARAAKFHSMDDFLVKKDQLAAITRNWVKMKNEG